MGLWKKITGVEKIEKRREAEEQRVREIEETARQAAEEYERKQKERAEEEARIAEEKEEQRKAEEFAKLSPKDQATEKGEPWVDVLQTHVNDKDIRNGFFELDWNDVFIKELIKAGYGTEADPEEEIVDRWFRGIVSQMLADEGQDPQRGSGYINVANLGSGRSEVS